MTIALALLAFVSVFVAVAVLSEKLTPIIGIGLLLVALGVAKFFIA